MLVSEVMDGIRARGRRRAAVPEAVGAELCVSELIWALSYALDLTEGACPGHAVRTCVLGMRIGQAAGLPEDLLHDLYYALLLKDVGCSSNSSRMCQIVGADDREAKQLTKTTDWTRTDWKQVRYLLTRAHGKLRGRERLRGLAGMMHKSRSNAEQMVRLRCNQGAKVVRDLGLGHATAGAIYCLDEHWDGAGYPDNLVGADIPLLARIANLAQVFEVYHREGGVGAALEVIEKRSGRWFDPELVRVAVRLERNGALTGGLDDGAIWTTVAGYEPAQRRLQADAYTIDNICVAFAGVVDAKSPYTFSHSSGVATVAQRIGRCLNLPARELVTLRRAGLLHDLGKLSVSNTILDKPGKLTEAEWGVVRGHSRYTFEILNRITGFGTIARVAASHHEMLDGSGYHLGLRGEDLPLISRILTVADIFDAMVSERPYRRAMETGQILKTMRKLAPHAIDAECVAALAGLRGSLPRLRPC